MQKKFKKNLLFGFEIYLEGQLMGCQNRIARGLLVNVVHIVVFQGDLKSKFLQISDVVKAISLVVVEMTFIDDI